MVTGNQAGNHGGGISIINAGIILQSSVITQNIALRGGGVFTFSNEPIIIKSSTISGNTATGGSGGGLYTRTNYLQLTNSTITGNSASNRGGGLYLPSTTDTLNFIDSCTITANHAGNSGGGVFARDIYITPLHNTIVAGNTTNGTTPDLKGNFSGDYNFIGDLGAATLTDDYLIDGDHNQTGSSGNLFDPLLGSLGNYGGSTPTKRPNSSSPVIDTGSCATLPEPLQDQRDQSRFGDACDIGAVEVQPIEDTVFIGSFEAY